MLRPRGAFAIVVVVARMSCRGNPAGATPDKYIRRYTSDSFREVLSDELLLYLRQP